MVEIDVEYQGQLRTVARHGPSDTLLATDAPRDNEGLGAAFSPTDLLATALGTCMLTTMGIVARRRGIAFEGARCHVEKHMVSEPVRRIGRVVVRFAMPIGLSSEARVVLERAALTCPVHRSLHPDVEVPTQFDYVD